MQYDRLIDLLKQVKTNRDLNEEITHDLIMASIGSYMTFILNDKNYNITKTEALTLTRGTILKHIDLLLLKLANESNDTKFSIN